MVWALTLLVCLIVFSPRIIAYLIPGWIGLSVIGLMVFWPHMPDFARSVVMWSTGTLLAAFLFAIPLRLVLGIPIAAGTIGCVALVICYNAFTIVGKVWHAITHAVTAAIGAITPTHWAAAGIGIVGLILVECWKEWRRQHPRPIAAVHDDPTDNRVVLRPAPQRRLSRAERKQAAIYAEIERKVKVSAAFQAWFDGRGPRPF